MCRTKEQVVANNLVISKQVSTKSIMPNLDLCTINYLKYKQCDLLAVMEQSNAKLQLKLR